MRTRRPRSGWRTAALAIATSVALPASVIVPGSVAAADSVPVAAAEPVAQASQEAGRSEARFEEAAFAEAKRTGEQVEILDRREETAEYFANSDGSTTRRTYGAPKWTRYEGRWKPADDRLVKKEDGSVAPAAPTYQISFSGGGDQPLATMVKEGKKLALTWPTTLPAPVVEGDTATYVGVLPDVDLKLIAEADGFAQHLVVNNAEAAANPALRSLTMGVETEGVTLAEGPDNSLLAKDRNGATVFGAPSPKMWEQPETSPEENGQQAGSKTNSAAAPSADADAAAQPDSAAVAVDVSGDALTLTPDPTLLAEADQFPLVIDPIFGDGDSLKWAVIYSATPSADYPNGSGWTSSTPANEPRVGYNGTGDTRSFFAMRTDGLQGATILDAKFAVTQTHTWTCNVNDAGPTELWSAGGIISTAPTWNSQDSYWGAKLDSDSFAGGHDTFCPSDLGHDFTSTALTNYVQKAATNNWTVTHFGLRTPTRGDSNTFKRFKNNPQLEVTYNYKPTVDDRDAYEGTWVPSGDGNKPVPCGSYIGNSGIALTAKVSDRDGGNVDAIFSVKNSAGTAISFYPNTHWKRVTSGKWASVTMPAKNLPNGKYTWSVYAADYEAPGSQSAPTASCSFIVDTKGPHLPVTVRDMDGTLAGQETDKYQARKPVTFKFSNTVADVAGYCWTVDRPVSLSGERCSNGSWIKAGTDAANTATVTLTPSGYPKSTLYVGAYDAAGNHSPIDGGLETVELSMTKSDFVYELGVTPVTPGTYPQDRRGDLNGDGFADFVATNPDGKLMLYKGNGTLGPMAAAVEVGTGGWGGALIAHRGDLQGFTGATAAPDGYEDFLVRLSNNRLYLYPGDGLGAPRYYARQEIDHPAQADWRGLKQIVMPGNIDGKPGNDLITTECIWDASKNCVNAELLLYSGRGIAGGGQNQTDPFDFANPTVIGTGGWRDFTNLAMDDLTGDGVADIVGRYPSDGKLYLYPGCLNKPECATGYRLGAPSTYGTGWNSRPLLTSPGNIQGTVTATSTTINDEGTIKTYHFKQFVPTAGEEYGDFWATTPADPDTAVAYVDASGNATSRLCPTGCLLTYPGGPTTHRPPQLVGTGAWATSITGIF